MHFVRQGILSAIFVVLLMLPSTAAVIHTYSGVNRDDPTVTLSGWFSISETTNLGSFGYLENSDIIDLEFTHSVLGTADISHVETPDFTILSSVTGIVTGGSGGLLSTSAPYNSPFRMTLYGGGQVSSSGWFDGAWSSYVGDPPSNVSAVPLPAGYLLLSTGLGSIALVGRRKAKRAHG